MIFTSKSFVEMDVILRRGGHINRSDIVLYQFACDHYDDLKLFYEQYRCILVHHQDGFFFLLSAGNILQSKRLPKTCMHLGIFIALKMRDPEITRTSGKLTINQLLTSMETSISKETLQAVYAPKQREASQYEKIRAEILRALKFLEDLRFLKIANEVIAPTEAINRFTELARYDNDPDAASREKLIAQRGVTFEMSTESEGIEEQVEENSDDVRENESADK